MAMHNAGKSIAEIRATIEASYRPHYTTMTPTSPPPADAREKGNAKREKGEGKR
jgi:hypothetical protein